MKSEILLDLIKILEQRMFSRYPLIQVVQGPRQVGKTTALIQFCDLIQDRIPVHYTSGDGVSSPVWIHEQWQLAQIQKKILIIDEIQKIPQWSENLKKLWDESKKAKKFVKCIISGSSSLSLQKGLTETMTGRFEVIPVFHWGYQSTQKLKRMSLDDYLIYGGYPGSYSFIKDKNRWREYLTSSIIETIIGKDILTQATVKNPSLFRQAFYLISSMPAQVVSYNKLLGQLQDRGNIDLVKYYIELYESAFLLKSIYKYGHNEFKKKTSSPKLILMAPALSTFHRLENLRDEDHGRIFESLVGAELIRNKMNPSYWCEGDYEVDYILNYKKELFAIEVKSKRQRKASSLELFMKKFPKAKPVFITKENFSLFSQNVPEFFDSLI